MSCYQCHHKQVRSVGGFSLWSCAKKQLKVALNDADFKAGLHQPKPCKFYVKGWWA